MRLLHWVCLQLLPLGARSLRRRSRLWSLHLRWVRLQRGRRPLHLRSRLLFPGRPPALLCLGRIAWRLLPWD
jgi:hypothetical protein